MALIELADRCILVTVTEEYFVQEEHKIELELVGSFIIAISRQGGKGEIRETLRQGAPCLGAS